MSLVLIQNDFDLVERGVVRGEFNLSCIFYINGFKITLNLVPVGSYYF